MDLVLHIRFSEDLLARLDVIVERKAREAAAWVTVGRLTLQRPDVIREAVRQYVEREEGGSSGD